MRRLKTGRRPPIYPKTPGHLPCSSLTHPLPLPSRRPSVSFGGFGLSTTVQEFKGNGRLSTVVVRDLKSGQVEELHPAGVFVFIGLLPNTESVKDKVELDRWGFIVTSDTLETSAKGIFAAGDARGGSTKQVASAVGEGATAALMVRQYLEAA